MLDLYGVHWTRLNLCDYFSCKIIRLRVSSFVCTNNFSTSDISLISLLTVRLEFVPVFLCSFVLNVARTSNIRRRYRDRFTDRAMGNPRIYFFVWP